MPTPNLQPGGTIASSYSFASLDVVESLELVFFQIIYL